MSFFKLAELIIFPTFCKLCTTLLDREGEKVVCNSCLRKLTPSYSSCCVCCGRFFSSPVEPHICKQCLEQKPPYSLHRSCGFYDGELKDILLLFKYKGFRSLGKDLILFAINVMGEKHFLWQDLDVIIPVPLHPSRQRQRGFNQSKILAHELARLKKIDIKSRILIKIKNRPPQTSLDAKTRRRNLVGAFKVKNKSSIKGKMVLLVDDIFTTGATLAECSKTLLKAGAKSVSALTLAQA
jgi:ComF family protein